MVFGWGEKDLLIQLAHFRILRLIKPMPPSKYHRDIVLLPYGFLLHTTENLLCKYPWTAGLFSA